MCGHILKVKVQALRQDWVINMARYSLIRGWLECAFDDIGAIEKVVNEHWMLCETYGIDAERAALYKKGWGFPREPMNWTSVIFYGGNVSQIAVSFLQDCMEKIAVLNIEICGAFFIDDEEETDIRQWLLNDGKFQNMSRDFMISPRRFD